MTGPVLENSGKAVSFMVSIWLTYRPHYAGLTSWIALPFACRFKESSMHSGSQIPVPLLSRRLCVGAVLSLLAGCSNIPGVSDVLNRNSAPAPLTDSGPAATPAGAGAVKVGLLLPLSSGGNAAVVAQSMKNAAEMALAEFSSPNVQLLVKDDSGTAAGAQRAAQQALNEGAEIIIGPLFAHAVGPVGAVARPRGVPVIAFSTDASVAARGVYLLSFLPESDVDRIVDFAIASGKRSFAALLSQGAYGNVVEAEFKQVVSRKGGRIVALERYALNTSATASAAGLIARAANNIDALFIPEGPEVVPSVARGLAGAGIDTKRVQLLGTGLWEDSRIFNEPLLHGGWYAAPDGNGYRNFSARYRQRFNKDPVRTATLAYDAVALVAALVKTQGPQRFTEQVLTSSSGFAGIDGLFRFRPDGTNERGLAVMQVSPTGGQIISPPPQAFGGSGI
jgi:ABC-type branched-subunit amino acid transport system substrate-binding protein